MTFTIEDAEDDGRLKAEVGTRLKSVLARESSELYEHFLNVCEEKGREPSNVLGDYVIKCIENEDFAQAVARQGVDLSVVKKNDIRKDDLDLVMELMEQFDVQSSGGSDPIMELVNKRIEAAGSGPLSAFADRDRNGGGFTDSSEDDLKKEIEELKRQNQQLAQQLQKQRQTNEGTQGRGGSGNTAGTMETEQSEREEDIDSIFQDQGDSEQKTETVEEDGEDTGDEAEQDSEVEEIEVKDFGGGTEQDENVDTDSGNEETGTFSTDEAVSETGGDDE